MTKAKSKPREQAAGMWGVTDTMWYHNCGGVIAFKSKDVEECEDCNITMGDVDYWVWKAEVKDKEKKISGRTKKA